MNTNIRSTSVLLLSDDKDLYGALLENNRSLHQIERRDSIEQALQEPELFTQSAITLFDIDAAQRVNDSAIDQLLKLKKIYPTQVVILLGSMHSLNNALNSNIQSLIFRAFRKPINPNQVFLSFQAADRQHRELTNMYAAGEDLLAVGAVENRTTISTMLDQRRSQTNYFMAAGMAAIALLGGLFFIDQDSPSEQSVAEFNATSEQSATGQRPIGFSSAVNYSADAVPNPDVDELVFDEFVEENYENTTLISDLLQKAGANMALGQFAAPEGDNAITYYEQILRLDTYHTEAYEGKQRALAAVRDELHNQIDEERFELALTTLGVLQRVDAYNVKDQEAHRQIDAVVNILADRARDAGNIADLERYAKLFSRLGSTKDMSDSIKLLKQQQEMLAEIETAINSNNLIPNRRNNAFSLLQGARNKGLINETDYSRYSLQLSDKLLKAAQGYLEADNLKKAKELGSLVATLGSSKNQLSHLNNRIEEKSKAVEKNVESNQQLAATDEVASLDAIIPAEIVKKVSPRYPTLARNRDIEGWVEIKYSINESGEPENLRVVNAHPRGVFDRAASNAVKRWRFKPARNERTGEAVRSEEEITRLRFKLS